RKSMEIIKQRSSMWSQGIDQSFVFTETINFLRDNFRSVEKVDDIDQLARTDASVGAVLDIYAKTPMSIFHKADVRIGLHFLTLDKKPLDKVEAKALVKPKGVGPPAVQGATRRAFDQVLRQLGKSLPSAKGLLALAESLPHKTAAAAPPAPRTSVVDEPGYQLAENPNDFALVIGIDKYKDLAAADYADRDADAVRRHLLALGYPERNIIHLKGADATRATFQGYLEEWLPKNVKPESTVFFYYSGHGAPDAQTGDAYLVPWDGNPQFLKSTAYPLKRLYASLDKLRAKRVIAALDACFSGAGGRSVLAKGARPLVMKIQEGVVPQGKIVLFAAASGDEITSTLDREGHGIFTYYFLKGLAADGRVTAQGLYEYLKPKVQDQARRQNREQTPSLQAGADVVIRPR
ncbi:MAG: caspase family protein, partial [Elusimicrobiota bacterium]